MANPLNSLLPQRSNTGSSVPQGIESFKRMAAMLNTAQNPSAALSAFAQKNPQMQMVLNMCQGKDPRSVFIQECQNRGIDPAQLMQALGLR